MTLTLELSPAEEARLGAAARQRNLAPDEVLHGLMDEHLPPTPEGPDVDPKNAAAAALLRSWLAHAATDDPERTRRAEQELDDFKRALNANRAATGERLLFP